MRIALTSLVFGIVTCVVPAVAVPPPTTAHSVFHGTISWTLPIPCTNNPADWEGTYTSVLDCTPTSTGVYCKVHSNMHLTATDLVTGQTYVINNGDNGSTDTLTFGLATTSVVTSNTHTRITGQGDGLVFTYSQQEVYTSTYDPVSDPSNPYTYNVDVKMVNGPECK